MAIVSYIKEKKQTVSAMKGVIDYCAQRKKVYDPDSDRELISGIHCQGQNAFLEFMATKQAYKKVTGINFYQYVQSFSPLENITPEKAHAVALEFAAQAWPGYEVQVTTHCDANHLHSHFVINSVSFETGRKLRQDPQTLKQLRSLSDSICQKHGLSILPPKKQDAVKLSAREYRAAAKGESWKFRLMGDIEFAMQYCGSQEDFIFRMKKRGYNMVWTQERKYITFTCPNGKKCRDNKLHHSKFRKENIEHELFIRQQLTAQLFSGQAGENEFSVYGYPGTGAVPSSGVRRAGDDANRAYESAEAGGQIPADSVQSDQHLGDQRRNPVPAAADAGNGAGISGGSPADSGDSQRPDGADHEADHLTGWEESREIYFRNFRHGGFRQNRYAGTGIRAPGTNTEAGHPHHHAGGSSIGAGLRGLAELGQLIEDDSEDEEERIKRIQAQQAGSDLGLALGLAIGVAEALTKSRLQDAQEEAIEENKWQQTM